MQQLKKQQLYIVLQYFLPVDGDVFVETPAGRAILLGGFSPLTLPGVLMSPCLSMFKGERVCGGLGPPHNPTLSQYDGWQLGNQEHVHSVQLFVSELNTELERKLHKQHTDVEDEYKLGWPSGITTHI